MSVWDEKEVTTMRKILLDSTKNFYKANFHCHSTKSDGKMTVEEIKDHYKKNGYSIVAYTDHEHLLDNSYLNDEDFLAITSCEVAVKEFPELSTLVKTDMKVAHLNFLARNPENTDTPCYNSVYDHFVKDWFKDDIVHTCGEYERVLTAEGVSEMIRIANEKGFLVTYNHPNWSLQNATDYIGYEGLWAVEVYNHECFCSGRMEYDIHSYESFLRAGKKIACVATDDNHSIDSTCGGWVMINADNLNYDAVFDAMEKHSLYSSFGPEIKELYVEGDTAYLTFAKGQFALMSTQGRRVSKQIALNPDRENKVEFKILPTDGYIRFDVVDDHNRRAHTCAYFLDQIMNIAK